MSPAPDPRDPDADAWRAAFEREREARIVAELRAEHLERRSRQQAVLGEVGRLGLVGTPPEILLQEAAESISAALGGLPVRVHEAGTPPDQPAAGFAVGDPDHPFQVLSVLEPDALEPGDRDFLEAVVNVLWYAVERGRFEEDHRHRSLHDTLTGLPNRALLFDRLRHALARARRTDGRVAVLLLDLDGFKAINDTLGHHAGDEVLRVVASRLAGVVRASDTVGRLGGDEFAVLCEGLAAPEAATLADRVAAAVAEPIVLDAGVRSVGASVGTAVGTGSDDPEDLLGRADEAMYLVKAARRGRDRPGA